MKKYMLFSDKVVVVVDEDVILLQCIFLLFNPTLSSTMQDAILFLNGKKFITKYEAYICIKSKGNHLKTTSFFSVYTRRKN